GSISAPARKRRSRSCGAASEAPDTIAPSVCLICSARGEADTSIQLWLVIVLDGSTIRHNTGAPSHWRALVGLQRSKRLFIVSILYDIDEGRDMFQLRSVTA